MLESHALALGKTIATQAAKFWLQRRRTQFERSASLAELAQAELKGPLQQRKLENLVDRIGQQVAEQLAPVMVQRFGDVPDNEASAAVLAVVDTLADVDLSDKALLSADADADVLARRIRQQFPQRTNLLTPRATELHELALDQACRHLVQVVRYLPSFQAAALGEVLTRLTAQYGQLDELLSRVPTTSLYAPRGTDRDDAFRTEYLAHLATTLDRLELLGLPGDEQPRLALTVAYLSLSVSGLSNRGRGRRRQDNWLPQSRPVEGVPLEAAIGGESRVLLRGDAGSGKTTLLNWLAVRAARGELAGELVEWNDCVPFIVRLRTFAERELPEAERFVAQGSPTLAALMPDAWAHRVLKSGRAMLLVDGVDEVPMSRRPAVKTWLQRLLAAFPKIRVVVTARTAAAGNRWLAEEQFTAVTLEPMNPDNIVDFVARWHQAAALSGEELGDAEARLRGQLERPHLRQLAASPLLCAMLCALNLAHRSELPRNRMDLYAKALAMLLHFRDAERGIQGMLSDTDKRVLLRDLAWRLTLANKIELSATEALDHITRKLPGMPHATVEPELIFRHLLERSGVLREPVPDRVDFVHRTFLEYLAADEAIQQHLVPALAAHAHLDTWWETIVMACGHATTVQANELLTEILDRAEQEPTKARHLRLLAAACLETVRDIAPEVSARIDATVREKLVPPRGLNETNSLLAIGHRILRYLPENLDELTPARAVATVRIAALAGTAEALPFLASYAQDPRPEVFGAVEDAWHYFDPERFADVVLSDSPLNNGQLTVASFKHLPFLRHLTKLTALRLYTRNDAAVEDLELLAGLPLQELSIRLKNDRPHDLRALGDQPRLRQVWLEGLSQTADLSPIAAFAALDQVSLLDYQDKALSRVNPLDNVSRVSLFHQTDGTRMKNAPRVFRSAKNVEVFEFKKLDITALATMASTEVLSIQSSTFGSIAPIARMSKLRVLRLQDTAKFDYDLRPLSALDLQRIELDEHCQYAGVESLSCEVKYV